LTAVNKLEKFCPQVDVQKSERQAAHLKGKPRNLRQIFK
jgi:hypothetical protein